MSVKLMDLSVKGSPVVTDATIGSKTAGNANQLTGKAPNVSNSGNTVVVRDGNGYIHGGYFNSQISNEDLTSISGVYFENASDNWIRKMSPNNFIKRLNLATKNEIPSIPTHLQPTFNNNTWYAVGDDVYIGDRNVGGTLCVKGNGSSNTAIRLYDPSESSYVNLCNNGGNAYLKASAGAFYLEEGTSFVIPEGKLTVQGPLFAYKYSKSTNTPAIIIDKSGTGYAGIGANGESMTIQFGQTPDNNGTSWSSDQNVNWDFKGLLKQNGNKVWDEEKLKFELNDTTLNITISEG